MSKLLSKLQEDLHDHTDDPKVVVPQLVLDFAQVVSAPGDPLTYKEMVLDAALLLRSFGVTEIEATAPRFLAIVDPLVTFSSRVDRILRAYILEEPEHLRTEAQYLWTTLEDRCEAFTGKKLKELLGV